MKLKNILISFTTIFALLFARTVSAETTAPDSFNVNGGDVYLIQGEKYFNGKINLYYQISEDGTVIYCTKIRKNAVTYGTQTYTLSKELDASYAYVIENGYPNKSLTGDKDKDYFITSLAIWYLSEPEDSIFTKFDFAAGTYNGETNDVSQNIAKLLNGAKNYTYITPSIEIYGNDEIYTLSTDKNYYVSNSLGVVTAGTIKNYTVSLKYAPIGTIITDVNGTIKNEFTTNEKFIINIPVTSINTLTNEFQINVSAKGSAARAYLYEPAQDKYQNVSVLYSEVKNVSDTVTDTLRLTTRVEISKVDAVTGKMLPGAILTVKTEKGIVVDTWVSTGKAHIIKNLTPGKYILIEEKAPEGYVLNIDPITFEVKIDGTITRVTMKNEPTKVQISKVDVTTGEELPGATLTIKNSNGKEIATWVSTNEPKLITGLAVGTYTLTETIAPEGYELSTETIEFEVKSDGTLTKVVMENKPKEKTPIYISKQDITTGKELAGAHLELRDEDGTLVEAWVSETTPHMIEELAPGKYFLTEILAPEGYELSTETVEFIVKEDGTVDDKIIMYNTPQEVVEVPNTSSFKTITSSLIGIIVIGLGSMIIYKNYKKNEEH